jgi:hypothetical protein
MKEFDIHHGMPTVDPALRNLETYINISKHSEKVIKIIHGYGSSGIGGAIRVAAREVLETKWDRGQIKAYIPGEAIATPMGFDELIRKYKPLLERDADFRKGNDGITYVFFQ